jgi:drug/metabolite transporter (DMT)-like permease
MSFTGLEIVTIGDPLVIICALLYAIYIIYIDRKAKEIDIFKFSQLQLLFITIASFGISAIIEDWSSIFTVNASMIFTLDHFLWLVYIGIAVTSLTFIFQVFGQRYIDETKTGLIFSLEPIFATFFAVLWGNELLSVQLYVGSILIFIGILISSVKIKTKREVKNGSPQL